MAQLVFPSVLGFIDGFWAWGHKHCVHVDFCLIWLHLHTLTVSDVSDEGREFSWFFLLFILNMHDLCFCFLDLASRSPAVNSVAQSLSSPSSGTADSSGARSSAGESGYEIKGKLATHVYHLYHRNKKTTQVHGRWYILDPVKRVELNKHSVRSLLWETVK